MYGGKFVFQNRLSWLQKWEGNLPFCFVLLCIRGQIPSSSPPGDLYSEGRFKGGFFCVTIWGAYILRGLFSEFYGILIERNTRNMGIAGPREARGRVPILNARNGKGREIV